MIPQYLDIHVIIKWLCDTVTCHSYKHPRPFSTGLVVTVAMVWCYDIPHRAYFFLWQRDCSAKGFHGLLTVKNKHVGRCIPSIDHAPSAATRTPKGFVIFFLKRAAPTFCFLPSTNLPLHSFDEGQKWRWAVRGRLRSREADTFLQTSAVRRRTGNMFYTPGGVMKTIAVFELGVPPYQNWGTLQSTQSSVAAAWIHILSFWMCGCRDIAHQYNTWCFILCSWTKLICNLVQFNSRITVITPSLNTRPAREPPPSSCTAASNGSWGEEPSDCSSRPRAR